MTAKGYSVRKARNYTRREDGTWKLHSSSLTDKGYTKLWPTVEDAEKAAKLCMSFITDPKAENFVVYCKIYRGNEYIKTVERMCD